MKGKTGKMDVEKGNAEKEGKVSEYNAVGAPGSKGAMDETADFKGGGKVKGKKMHGGHAKGKAPKGRLDRKPRAAGGRSPLTSANKTSSEDNYKDDNASKDVTGDGAMTEIPVYRKGGKV